MKRIMNKIFTSIVVLAALLPLSGCDTVLEYPDGGGIDPTLIKVRVQLSVDFSMISDPLISSYAEAHTGDFDVRYQLAFYAVSGAHAGELVERMGWTSDVIESGPTVVIADADLHAERYAIYAWIDFVPRGTTGDCYYVTEDLRKVSIADPNVCGLDTRDAFSGKTAADLTPYRNVKFADVTIPLPMERPFGKFKILTTDVRKFLDSYKPVGTYADIMPSASTVRYTCYFPTAYNQDTRLAHVDAFRLDVSHTSDVAEIEENNAVLSSNYVFICNDDTTVTADLEVRNSAEQLLSTVHGITIPIQRNRLTIVKGEFLTTGVNGGPVIVPEFDGEFNIQI